jgi:hypothetical protein
MHARASTRLAATASLLLVRSAARARRRQVHELVLADVEREDLAVVRVPAGVLRALPGTRVLTQRVLAHGKGYSRKEGYSRTAGVYSSGLASRAEPCGGTRAREHP